MVLFSTDQVESSWEAFNRLDDKQANIMVEEMSESQPFVLSLVLSWGEEELNEEEAEFLLFMGMFVWFTYRNHAAKTSEVNEKMLADTEVTNMKMLEYLTGETEQDFIDFTLQLVENFPQPHLLKLLVEEIYEEQEALRPDNQGMVLIYCKIIIECLEKARTRKG